VSGATQLISKSMLILSPHTASVLSPLTADQSWVMFVQTANPPTGFGPIKIEGVRGTQIATRLREISAENAFDTYIIGLTPTETPDELANVIHTQFASALLHHDWFEATLDLISFIQHTAQDALESLLAQARPGGVPDGAVDIETIAGFLGVSVPTIRRAVKAREIPFFKMGKAYRFVPADVLASLERNR
jgi:excisionase family DNA binding protein